METFKENYIKGCEKSQIQPLESLLEKLCVKAKILAGQKDTNNTSKPYPNELDLSGQSLSVSVISNIV
jgi:hypothetical protein